MKRIALLHGAGYTGGELIRLLAHHPECTLTYVTSRTFAGQPVSTVHPTLTGVSELVFSGGDDFDPHAFDGVLMAAEHGQGAAAFAGLQEAGYTGVVVDLSADFRLRDAGQYPTWYKFDHPAPKLLSEFHYGLVEATTMPSETRYVANPGCFASGIALALFPIAQHVPNFHASITALTGASGSGARPKPTTHFPTRDGNVRAYKVLGHQHLPEILQILGDGADLAFTPVSGPWVRGIWGTAQITLEDGLAERDIAQWYEAAYGDAPLVRLWPKALPELRYAVNTPFCDIGWMVKGRQLIIGFALDNLLKGASSQAIQNLNLLFGFPDATGLLPNAHIAQASLAS